MRRRYVFIAVVALQLVFLAAEAARYSFRITHGQTVLLKVIPVDPRSMFMGHYLMLSYDISSIPAKLGTAGLAARRGPDSARGWVVLEPGRPAAKAVGVVRTLPADWGGRVYLQATLEYAPSTRALNATLGLERYYIPEDREQDAAELWERLRGSNPPVVTAEVSVDRRGRGMIKQLLVDGRPLGY